MKQIKQIFLDFEKPSNIVLSGNKIIKRVLFNFVLTLLKRSVKI